MDVLYIALLFALFGVGVLLVLGCSKLAGHKTDPHHPVHRS